jgi:hypothetical protein
MISMQCPTGLLITPERMWVYRDRFSSPPDVERVGEFDMSGIWQHEPPANASAFELFAQQWLEHVGQQPTKNMPRNFVKWCGSTSFPLSRAGM